VRYWDASALVTLVAGAGKRERLEELYGDGGGVWIWWVTPVEITSSIARRERSGELTGEAATHACAVLEKMAATWHQLLPTDALRESAKRLLRIHPLRAADSLQLASALSLSGPERAPVDFVCRDARLSAAAAREGLRVPET
jgi:predicted nucleic acid-binding protein